MGAETDLELSGLSMLESGGDGGEGLAGGEGSRAGGAAIMENVRLSTPALRRGLIAEMEEEAREAGLRG